jgi:lysozyme
MHRFVSELGVEFIKKFEGCSLSIYQCSAGYPTIGYGHKIKPDENFDVIDYCTADELLKNDLVISERAVIRNIESPLSDYQFDALVSFTFNLGSGALQRSTLKQKINASMFLDSEDIHHEFLRWTYAGGIKVPGLIHRRDAEAKLYNYGEY